MMVGAGESAGEPSRSPGVLSQRGCRRCQSLRWAPALQGGMPTPSCLLAPEAGHVQPKGGVL